MGASRGYVRKWVGRFDEEGEAGLVDRSSRPHRSPGRSSPAVGQRVVDARRRLRAGPVRAAAATGLAERTVTRNSAAEGCFPVAGLRPADRGAQTTGGAEFGDTVGTLPARELLHYGCQETGDHPRRRRVAGARAGKRRPT